MHFCFISLIYRRLRSIVSHHYEEKGIAVKVFQFRVMRIVIVVIALLVVAIQFVHSPRNESNDNTHHILNVLPVPDSVADILKRSCYDCHSNATVYPWYNSIQPIAWWLNDHVEEGKRELNFSEFASYRAFRQLRKLQEIDTQLIHDDMPLPPYLIIHRDASLGAVQKALMHNWVLNCIDSLRRKYPADSLQRPAGPRPERR